MKLSKALLSIFCTIILTLSVAPANAAGNLVAVTRIWGPLDIKLVRPIPKDRVLVISVTESAPGNTQLQADVVGTNGAYLTGFTFDAGTQVSDFLFTEESFVELKGGGYAFAWTHQDAGTPNEKNYMFFSYSKDGVTWSAKAKPLPAFDSSKFPWSSQGGYGYPALAVDGSGVLAIGYTVMADTRSNTTVLQPVNVITTTNYKTWSAARTVNSTHSPNKANYIRKIFGLPGGGFLVFWADQVIATVSFSDLYVARLPKGKTKFEAASFLFRTSPEQIPLVQFVPQSATKFTLLLGHLNSSYRATLDYATYDSSSGKLGTFTTLGQLQENWFIKSKSATSTNSTGVTSVIFTGAANDVFDSEMFRVQFFPGAATPVFDRVFDFEVSDGDVYAALVDADDNTQVLYYSGWAFFRFGKITGGQLVPGDQLPVAQYGDYVSVAKKSNSDIVVLDQAEWLGETKVISYKLLRAPVVSAHTAVVGTSKVKQTLTARAAKYFAADLPGLANFSWYRCTNAVATNLLSAPNSCTVVEGQTKATYKLTATDKGFYLVAASTSVNSTGSTSSFSKSTQLVK